MSRMADPQVQLSHAVWDVLAKQGIERLTIRAVAAAAGCTTGLVMHRFPNRRALLRHARQLLHERTLSRAETLESEAPTPRAALHAVLAQGLALNEETAAESTVWIGFLAAAVGDKELTSLHQTNNQAWRERITRLVAKTAPHWPKSQVKTTTFALIAMIEGAAALAATNPTTYPPQKQKAMLTTTLKAFNL